MLRAVAAATGLVGAAAHRLTRATTHAPVDGITDVHAWSGYGPPIDDKEVVRAGASETQGEKAAHNFSSVDGAELVAEPGGESADDGEIQSLCS